MDGGGALPGGSRSSGSVREVPPPVLLVAAPPALAEPTAPPALTELTAPLLLVTYKEPTLLARSRSRESPRPKGSYLAGTSAECDARGRRAPGELEQLPEQPEQLSGQPEGPSPPPPQKSGLEFYERWLVMTRSWEETAKVINNLVFDTELRFRLTPSLAEVDDLRAQLERANECLGRMERRKLEYEQRFRRHIEVGRRAELNFMMHLVAANDLVNFLKWEVRRVAASKEEVVATAVREAGMEMAAKYGVVLEGVTEKFRRKEAEITAEIHSQERIANFQLLEDLSSGKIIVSREMERFTAEHPAVKQALVDAAIFYFSIGALDLPEVSVKSINREDMAIQSCLLPL